MPSEDFIRGMLYVSLTVVGVPGNAVVIVVFLLLSYEESRLLTADAIVLHLACANFQVVAVRCLLETLGSFRVVDVFGDAGCKGAVFFYRMSRGLSIWLTFVLSAYQCLSFAPPGSCWATARSLLAQYLALVFLVLWAINTGMSSGGIVFSSSTRNVSSLTKNAVNIQFCQVTFPSKAFKEIYGAVQVGRDVVPMSLMTLASAVILVLLYRHGRNMKKLRGSSSSGGTGGAGGAGSGSKRRAAKVVVVLVTLYVVLYGVDNGLWVYTLTVKRTMSSSLISDLRIFFASLYAALSPLVIIVSNRKVNGRLRRASQKPNREKSSA